MAANDPRAYTNGATQPSRAEMLINTVTARVLASLGPRIDSAVREAAGRVLAEDRADLTLRVGNAASEMASEKVLEGVAARLEALEARHVRELRTLMESQRTALEAVLHSLQSLPTPRVVIPDGAIQVVVQQEPSQVIIPEKAILVHVHQEPSHVHIPDGAITLQQAPPQVTIPEGAITVRVEQPPSQVTIPDGAITVKVDQKPSHVHLPDGAIKVDVEPKIVLPRAKKTRTTKTVIYDQTTGRPDKIIEDVEEV